MSSVKITCAKESYERFQLVLKEVCEKWYPKLKLSLDENCYNCPMCLTEIDLEDDNKKPVLCRVVSRDNMGNFNSENFRLLCEECHEEQEDRRMDVFVKESLKDIRPNYEEGDEKTVLGFLELNDLSKCYCSSREEWYNLYGYLNQDSDSESESEEDD